MQLHTTRTRTHTHTHTLVSWPACQDKLSKPVAERQTILGVSAGRYNGGGNGDSLTSETCKNIAGIKIESQAALVIPRSSASCTFNNYRISLWCRNTDLRFEKYRTHLRFP